MTMSTSDISDPGVVLGYLVVVGFVLFVVIRLLIAHRQGSDTDPLPRLDPVAREAKVVAVHPAQPNRPRRGRRRVLEPTDPDDGPRLIEVEYTDAEGRVRRECLADVIPQSGRDRFAIGQMCRVHAFVEPRTRFMQHPPAGGPPAGRCVLAAEHDDVERAGGDVDGMRAHSEHWLWGSTRAGSPFLGVMPFVTDENRWTGQVLGSRTSFPGAPHDVWRRVPTGPVPRLARPPAAPRPESVAEVARWEDPNGFARTELSHAPIFWVCIPLAALGVLIWGIITDPRDGWTGNLFADDDGQPWHFWLVWAGVIIWLLIAVGVLALRIAVARTLPAEHEWIFRHGRPCSLHVSPFARSGGEGESWPTFIAIDESLPDDRAAMIHRALHTWLSDGEAQDELERGVLAERSVISSQELFGDIAAGGYYVSSIPEFGSADHFAAHRWVLITEPRDPDDALHVTTVPLEEKREKIRRRLSGATRRPR